MAGGRISDKYREYGCNDNEVVMLAVATRDSTEEILYGYNRNGCDSVQFGLITQEGGAVEIGELMGMGGKAGPTYLISPDKTISEKLHYSTYAIENCFNDAGIEPNECDDTLLAPTVRVVSPKMNEVVQPDSTYEVQWVSRDSDGIASTALYFSSDNGSHWELVDSIAGDDSTFSWQVPDIASEECRLKFHVYDTKMYMREKISIYFTIPGTVGGVHQKILPQSLPFTIVQGSLWIPYQEQSYISVTDLSGRIVREFGLQKDREQYSWAKGLSSGMYVVSLFQKGVQQGSYKTTVK